MTGLKTNEVAGTRAVLRHYRMSATKARQVLDLVRGHDVDRAEEILRNTEREAARVVSKVLASAVSNAQHNDAMDPEELYVSACFADEGATLKRWRPRARGRATRIRKRTCHITVIVSRLPEDRLERRRARSAGAGVQRSRRVAASRRGEDATSTTDAGTPEPAPDASGEPAAAATWGTSGEPAATDAAGGERAGEDGAAMSPATGGETGAGDAAADRTGDDEEKD
ncbi:MAG: 50S ribosomal protein L22 [Actinomycetota bacterium]|nr:50S ribosomal protein L22 [Actinomycetota bacterium]